MAKNKIEIENESEFNALILLTKETKIELKSRISRVEFFDYVSGNLIAVKISKKSKLYNLLSGYLMFKSQFRKSRLITVEVDLKGNVTVLEDKKLKAVEKKYKKLLDNWTIVHKCSFGI